MTATVSARGLNHRYGSLKALEGIDLEIAAGEVLAIVGPSGCGKSTLLELVGGLAGQSEGQIEVAGQKDLAGRLRGCAWMPQRDCLLPWYSALDNAALALLNQGRSKREARADAAGRFEHFGLAGFEGARPDELSGGMRQRVAFIRTLVSGKPVLLLDEQLAALDAITRAELQEWLVLSPRPGRLVATIEGARDADGGRDEVVSSPDFNRRREELLHLLRSAGGPAA